MEIPNKVLVARARQRVESGKRAALWGKPETGAKLHALIMELADRLEELDEK